LSHFLLAANSSFLADIDQFPVFGDPPFFSPSLGSDFSPLLALTVRFPAADFARVTFFLPLLTFPGLCERSLGSLNLRICHPPCSPFILASPLAPCKHSLRDPRCSWLPRPQGLPGGFPIPSSIRFPPPPASPFLSAHFFFFGMSSSNFVPPFNPDGRRAGGNLSDMFVGSCQGQLHLQTSLEIFSQG